MSRALSPRLASAQKWFDAGVQEAAKFKQAFQAARERAFNAGFLFMKARQNCPEGEWTFLLETNAAHMKPRTVRFFIQLAEAGISWVQQLMPETPGNKIQEVVTKEVMLLSPKPLVALLRDLRAMRPFGEYDEIKYAQRKLATGSQLELDFTTTWSVLEELDHLDATNFSLKLPEGKTEHEAFQELDAKLSSIQLKLRAQLTAAKTTDI